MYIYIFFHFFIFIFVYQNIHDSIENFEIVFVIKLRL